MRLASFLTVIFANDIALQDSPGSKDYASGVVKTPVLPAFHFMRAAVASTLARVDAVRYRIVLYSRYMLHASQLYHAPPALYPLS